MKYNLAHRGLSGIAPENTRTAFREAKEFNFDGVELDVHLTLDNELVIIHDEKINRTADGRGAVKDMKLEKLRKYNFAKNFIGIENETILTLGEFLEEFAKEFKVINIELKTDVHEYEGIEAKVLEAIADYPQEKFILSSFNFDTVKRLRKLDKKIPLGFLFKKHKDFTKIPRNEILEVCNYLHPSKVIFNMPLLKTKYDSFKLPYNVWTIKSKRTFNKVLKNPKVHSVICNYKYNKKAPIFKKHQK